MHGSELETDTTDAVQVSGLPLAQIQVPSRYGQMAQTDTDTQVYLQVSQGHWAPPQPQIQVIPALAGIENKQKFSKKSQVQTCRYSLGAFQMCGLRRYRYMFAGTDILLGKQKKFYPGTDDLHLFFPPQWPMGPRTSPSAGPGTWMFSECHAHANLDS